MKKKDLHEIGHPQEKGKGSRLVNALKGSASPETW
jgi:hypothetical protein